MGKAAKNPLGKAVSLSRRLLPTGVWLNLVTHADIRAGWRRYGRSHQGLQISAQMPAVGRKDTLDRWTSDSNMI